MKSCIVITSLLLMLVPLSSAENSETPENDLLTTTVIDGFWVNETLTVNGSTNLDPQSASWVLYDVSDSYISTESIIDSGEFFSVVLPVSEGLWDWSLTIDVSEVNCTCRLEISQPNNYEGNQILNRVIFIGEGPHNPFISSIDGNSILIDAPEELSYKAVLSDSLPIDASLILTGCSAPNGACVGESFTSPVTVEWNSNIATFNINATDLGLTDGIWKFVYVLQDAYLRSSPPVEITVYVDQSDPVSSLICPEIVDEGSDLLIDGSGSTDTPWTENTQFVWYITAPDDSVYSPISLTSEELLNISLVMSGEYTIRLDVIDWVGRMSSSQCKINVNNVPPTIELIIDGTEVNSPKTWNFFENEELHLVTLISETGDDLASINYSWFLNDEPLEYSSNITLSDLEAGDYQLRLVVVDDDGAEETYELEISVNSKPESNDQEFNFAALVAIIGIIVFSLFMFKRLQSPENVSGNLPKWNDGVNKESQSNKENSDSENRLWE